MYVCVIDGERVFRYEMVCECVCVKHGERVCM